MKNAAKGQKNMARLWVRQQKQIRKNNFRKFEKRC